MDPYIRTALDRPASSARSTGASPTSSIRHVAPVASICPNCGKVGTTIVTDWDGETVFFECRADLVTWATGCGTSGWIARSAGTRSCRGTSNGPPSGRSSA
jgi:lysyl-tRNA synthetase class 1